MAQRQQRFILMFQEKRLIESETLSMIFLWEKIVNAKRKINTIVFILPIWRDKNNEYTHTLCAI